MGKLYNKSNIPIDVIISPELEVAKSLYRRLEVPELWITFLLEIIK